jgi:hypothetical protein
VAAVVIAAEAWHADGDPERFHAQLNDELRVSRDQLERDERASWPAGQQWPGNVEASRPGHASMSCRVQGRAMSRDVDEDR